jgi:hypothetical protein
MGSHLREYTGCSSAMVVYKYQHSITMDINTMKVNTGLLVPNFSNCKYLHIIAVKLPVSTTLLYTDKYTK